MEVTVTLVGGPQDGRRVKVLRGVRTIDVPLPYSVRWYGDTLPEPEDLVPGIGTYDRQSVSTFVWRQQVHSFLGERCRAR